MIDNTTGCYDYNDISTGMSCGQQDVQYPAQYAPQINSSVSQDCVSVYTSKNTQLIFANLTNDNMDKKGKYSACLGIPKSAPEIEMIQNTINMVIQLGKSKYGNYFYPSVGGMHDGDLERSGDNRFASIYFINASSNTPPQLCDGQKSPLTTRYQINSASVGLAYISFYPFMIKNGMGQVQLTGIGCQIHAFMKLGEIPRPSNIDYFANYRW